MSTSLRLAGVVGLALWAVNALHAQSGTPIVSKPMPAPVMKRGLMVAVRDIVRLPDTRGMRPLDQDVTPAGWARINFVRDLPDGRRFVNDSRGMLYVLDGSNRPSVYANVASVFPFAIYNRLESGFIGFTFHPEFSRTGLFYTVHGERATGNPATPNFIPARFFSGRRDLSQRHHGVARDESCCADLRRHTARAAACRARCCQLDAPIWRSRIQSDGEAWRSRLRPALYEWQRPRVQQRWRSAREQSRPGAAA